VRDEFVVPSQVELVSEFGVESAPVANESHVRRFVVEFDGVLAVTYDVPARSVRIQWAQQGAVRADIVREGATRLSVGSGAVTVAFRTEELRGELAVQVYPVVAIRDVMLLP
jgi:hypothetical protein